MVAIPTLLISEDQIRDLVRSLEIRYVGNRDPHLFFALLTDPPDSRERFDEKDHHVSLCSGLIEQLNQKYNDSGVAPFYHFHRHRVLTKLRTPGMGWERKRGKLLDFNELLRGETDKFPVKIGDLSNPHARPLCNYAGFGHAVASRLCASSGRSGGSPAESRGNKSRHQHGSTGLRNFSAARRYQRTFRKSGRAWRTSIPDRPDWTSTRAPFRTCTRIYSERASLQGKVSTR